MKMKNPAQNCKINSTQMHYSSLSDYLSRVRCTHHCDRKRANQRRLVRKTHPTEINEKVSMNLNHQPTDDKTHLTTESQHMK